MDASQVPVSEVMQSEFMHLSPKDGLDFVEEVMGLGRVRHFPVLDDGKLVGIVSHRDLLAASLTRILDFEGTHRRSFLHSVEVGEVMSHEVRTVGPDIPLADVARIMLRHKIGCVVVVNEKREPLGLVTESDLLARAYLFQDE
jgi:CBS domain-containing membrane protein